MSQKPEYIQLVAGEEVISIRDRLSFMRGRRVLIIWPEEGTSLTRKLDLVLIQREAKRRVLHLALVTHDKDVIEHANDLGISTFSTIEESEKGRWRRGRTKVFVQRYHRPEDNPEPDELMDVASRVRNPRRRVSPIRYVAVRLVVIAILISIIGGAVYVAIPGATINITVAKETINIETTIIADPQVNDINIDTRTIPATVLRATVQTTNSIATTGTEQGNNTSAIGIVTFTNQTERAVTIPLDTEVSTSAGTPVVFRTVAPASLPAGVGQRVDVAIEAVTASAGQIGNIEAGLINQVIGLLNNDVTVRNLAATTGGETRAFSIVTVADQDRLLGLVRGQLQALAFEEMQGNLIDTQLIVIETIRITEERNDWTTYSHNEGDIADTLSLSMRAVVEAVAIDDRFASQIVFGQLSQQKPRGLSLLTESFEYIRGAVSNVSETDQITFIASGNAEMVPQVNTIRLRERLVGQTTSDALIIINQEARSAPNTTPEITIEPSWFSTMPLLEVRIQVNVNAINSIGGDS